jgi:hypothetical protein
MAALRELRNHESVLQENFSSVNNQMKEMAKRIKSSHVMFGEEQMKEWQSQLLEYAEKLAAANHELSSTSTVCQNFKDSGGLAQITEEAPAAMEKEVSEIIRNQIETGDRKDFKGSEIYKNIQNILVPKKKKRDDDIEVTEELSEKSFICPISQMRFDEIWKNTSCSHRISKAGLQTYRQSVFECPVPGCSKRWLKTQVSRDNDREAEMQRFFRVGETQTQRDASNAVDADTGENEEEFTML